MHPFKSTVNILDSSQLNGDSSSPRNNINATTIQTDQGDNETRSPELMKLELLSLLVNGNGITKQNEDIRYEDAAPERDAFPTKRLCQDYDSDANVTFRATAVRESYTLQNVKQALRQGTMGESHGMDQSFVDFVMGGLIEDELELYRKKKFDKMLQRNA